MKGVAVDGRRAREGATVAERLDLHSTRQPNGCLVFTGAVHDEMGYGRMGVSGRQHYVHRLAYEIAHGPVPVGAVVRHTCDNPRCIEPRHLVPGTQAENVSDMISRRRFNRSGERNNSAKLAAADVSELRRLRRAGVTVADLARQFGICKTQVRNIVNGTHWKEIDMPLSLTLAQAIDSYGVDVLDHLDRQAAVPVSAGLIRQGDVIVIPAAMAGQIGDPPATPVGRAGVPVVRGESGGNTHLLLADGAVFFDPFEDGSLTIGALTVADGATAFLAHPEHAYQGIAPGRYVIRRQREQRDAIEMVAD